MLLLHVTAGAWGLSPWGNVGIVALAVMLATLIVVMFAVARLRKALFFVTLLPAIALLLLLSPVGDAGAHSAAYGPQYCGHGNYVYSNGNYRDEYAYGQWVDLYTHRHTINHWVKTWPWQSGQPDFWHTYTADCSS